MLSIELIRQQPDMVLQALRDRGEEAPMGRLLELDEQRRQLIHEGDELRGRRNSVSRELGRSSERPPELIEEMRQVGDRIRDLEQMVKDLEGSLEEQLLALPNLALPDVPLGAGEEDNIVISTWGEPPSFDFEPAAHWDLGENLGIIDFQRGVKLSGSRFFTLNGAGARLERALISWMLDVHTERGYREMHLPALVKQSTMLASGNLPKFGDNLYHDEEDDLWLVPTAEVPLTSLHADEVLPYESLPLYYAAYTPCFRREKAAAGRDTRGIKRVHQFDKVEMYKFVAPERSNDELESLREDAENLCRQLGLHYRVLQLCTGELGFASAKSYDIELWGAGSQEWLEVSSCSNCVDFQARRANVRCRPEGGGRPIFAHTLNGSGLALPRLIIAILESYQQGDGSISVPEVLRPYMRMDVITGG